MVNYYLYTGDFFQLKNMEIWGRPHNMKKAEKKGMIFQTYCDHEH